MYTYIQTNVHKCSDLLLCEKKHCICNIYKIYFCNYTLSHKLWIYKYLVFISTKNAQYIYILNFNIICII